MKMFVFGCLSMTIGVVLPSGSRAQGPAPPSAAATQLEEIIVTAEKRSTNLQSTPISVTPLSDATLQEHQVRDLKDIQALVPNFKMGDAQGIAQITIRGIGSSSFLPGTEGAVAVNENEVYVSRNIAQQAGLFDISGIEVLRGPQGTLFGRNATAGAVNITTAQPTSDVSGYFRQSVGNYGESRTEAAIGGPIVGDTVLGRVAAFRETHDGYGTNYVTGTGIDDKNDYGFRGTLLVKPTEDLTGMLIAEYFNENDHSGGFHYFGAAGLSALPGALGAPPLFQTDGGYAPSNIRDIANGIDPKFQLITRALTGIINWTSGPLSIKSITGYRNQDANFLYDIDGGSTLNGYEVSGEPAHQISEELQIHYDTGTLHVTGGAYYFHEEDDLTPQSVVASTYLETQNFGIPFATPYYVDLGTLAASLSTKAGAGFAQGSYDLTDKLSLTAGVRYSVETKHMFQQYRLDLFTPYTGSNPPPPSVDIPAKTFYSTTPKAGIQYQLDPQTFLFASYSQGFKSGGFDSAVKNPQPYLPEKLTDYEIGIKTTALYNRLRANVSGFYYDYQDLQVQQVVGLAVQTGNAATARVYGVEGEFNYLLTSALEVDASAAWTHARYVNYVGPDPALPLLPTVSFRGNALDNAPDYEATLSAQYTWNSMIGSLAARAEAEYSSRFYFSPGNEALLSQGAYVKGNLFAIYRPNSAWEITAYVRNISNTTTKTSALVASPLAANPVLGSLAPPRLVGAVIQYKF